MDFYSIPAPNPPVWVVAVAKFSGDSSKNQLSFEKDAQIMVLRAKPGAPWAIGALTNGQRGLYPMDYVRDRPLDKTPSGPSQRDALPSSIVRFPAASAPVSPRPVASAAPQQAVAPRQQAVSPRPEPAKAAAAASAPPPSRVVATAAPPPQNPISPRPLAGSQTTRVTADFAIQIEEQLNEEAPVSVFSGAASASLDGLRYEFERERDKHVMETDKKGKTLVGAVRRWMIIKAASDGNLDLVKCCIKGGIPIDTREALTGDTPVMAAILKRKFSLAKTLIKDFGSQPNCVNNSMQSALHFAVSANDEDMVLFLVKLGVDTLQKDVAGSAPLFMCKTKELEQKMRKAEKKVKSKLEPLFPPGREKLPAKPVSSVASEPEGRKKSSLAGAASQLVRPVDDDAKSVKGVAWNTLRGTTDCVDVIFVYIAGTGTKALPVPIKKTTSADDIINICAQKLFLTEFQRYLVLCIVSEDLQATEIPGFKSVLTVKQSYPRSRFVLFPARGAHRDVAVRLQALAEAADSADQ